MTTTTERVRGSWTKLEDGSFGVQVRCGGRGSEMVGRQALIQRKSNGQFDHVTLGDVVRDYGSGDVVIFRAIR